MMLRTDPQKRIIPTADGFLNLAELFARLLVAAAAPLVALMDLRPEAPVVKPRLRKRPYLECHFPKSQLDCLNQTVSHSAHLLGLDSSDYKVRTSTQAAPHLRL